MPTLETALSEDRLSTYRLWAAHDDALAHRLYTFNVQLSAALYGPLHMLEVTLRNVADSKLATVFGNDWMDGPDVLRSAYQKRCVHKAREQLGRDDKAGTHGQMIAELNFGFWSSLFGRPSHHLWQHLRPLFQTAGIQRHDIALQFSNFAYSVIAWRITSQSSSCRLHSDMPISSRSPAGSHRVQRPGSTDIRIGAISIPVSQFWCATRQRGFPPSGQKWHSIFLHNGIEATPASEAIWSNRYFRSLRRKSGSVWAS